MTGHLLRIAVGGEDGTAASFLHIVLLSCTSIGALPCHNTRVSDITKALLESYAKIESLSIEDVQGERNWETVVEDLLTMLEAPALEELVELRIGGRIETIR